MRARKATVAAGLGLALTLCSACSSHSPGAAGSLSAEPDDMRYLWLEAGSDLRDQVDRGAVHVPTTQGLADTRLRTVIGKRVDHAMAKLDALRTEPAVSCVSCHVPSPIPGMTRPERGVTVLMRSVRPPG